MSKIVIDGKEVEYEQGTTFEQIAKEYQKDFAQEIVLVFFNGRLRELNKRVKEGGMLSFVTVADKPGIKAYRRTVCLLMQKALHDLLGDQGVGVRVLQTTGNGQYCELTGTDMTVTDELLKDLGARMRRLADANLLINKENHSTAEAVKLFHELGMTDKEKTVRLSPQLPREYLRVGRLSRLFLRLYAAVHRLCEKLRSDPLQ